MLQQMIVITNTCYVSEAPQCIASRITKRQHNTMESHFRSAVTDRESTRTSKDFRFAQTPTIHLEITAGCKSGKLPKT